MANGEQPSYLSLSTSSSFISGDLGYGRGGVSIPFM